MPWKEPAVSLAAPNLSFQLLNGRFQIPQQTPEAKFAVISVKMAIKIMVF